VLSAVVGQRVVRCAGGGGGRAGHEGPDLLVAAVAEEPTAEPATARWIGMKMPNVAIIAPGGPATS